MNIVKSIFILVAVLSLATISTHSVFTSQASVVGNEFSTGTFPAPLLTPAPSLSPSPTPTPTPTPSESPSPTETPSPVLTK